MASRKRGDREDEMTKAMIRFAKEYLGRGPSEAKTRFVGDMIVVRLAGLLPSGEAQLAQTDSGRALIKETRRQILETVRPVIEKIAQQITGCEVVSFHTDLSTKTGERLIVLIMNCNLDELF